MDLWISDYLARTGDLGPLVHNVLRDIFFCISAVISHPIIKMKVRHKKIWKIENTRHSQRDWLSHNYAYRHSYNEVFEWFENLGFRIVDVQSLRGCLKTCHASQATDHEMDHRDTDHGFTGLGV